jgi:hypothetical protein
MVAAIAKMKKRMLRTMVTRNKTLSIPRRAVNTPPVSPPVSPPRPAPLLCKITLTINAIDVIIIATSIYDFTETSDTNLLWFLTGGLYLLDTD